MDKWLRAGVVGRPHGLDGSFHVIDARPELLAVGVCVRIDAIERVVERRAGADVRVILRVHGCADRDGAEALRGREVEVARTQAPALEPDEWWAEDLEGCAVHDGSRPVGMVRRPLALPSCELLEVAREGEADLLVPLVADAVRGVDVEQRRIDVDLHFLVEV